jgi:hypothetical protein
MRARDEKKEHLVAIRNLWAGTTWQGQAESSPLGLAVDFTLCCDLSAPQPVLVVSLLADGDPLVVGPLELESFLGGVLRLVSDLSSSVADETR